MIDTHCHLDASEFDADRAAVIDRASAGGVLHIVVPAVDAGNWPTVQRLAEAQAGAPAGLPTIHFALGIHPLFVDRAGDQDLIRLRQAVLAARGSPYFVGIGEIGLDHFVAGADRARQLHFFVEQLRIASDFDLPVILHVRRAIDPISRELRRFRPRSGIAHAFNGSAQQAEAMIGCGMALGFGGACTYTRANRLRRLAVDLPLDALVLETDAPDIPPEWCAGARNEPAELPRIARVIAQLRGIGTEELVRVTSINARRVLGLGAD